MKSCKYWLYLFFSLLLFCNCNETHFLKDSAYRSQVIKDFKAKRDALPSLSSSFNVGEIDSLSLEEREALMFLYAYMPLGDITDYSSTFYLNNVRLSFRARREMGWGASIPENLFRHFVLPVRVNNENMDESRAYFFNELKDELKGLNMREAVLNINHWCHKKVSYHSSDIRTSSPLATLKTAYGRCGEESTFVVAALRAVGIPARQIYVPRWAHTDDNHSWVEVWVDGKWNFIGACEPEPVLNLAWFNIPVSRSILMHTKVFGPYKGNEEVISTTPNFTEINVTDNYADVSKVVFRFVNHQGDPLSGVKVQFKVYNYAEFHTVATKYSDVLGQITFSAGKGDMLIWASKGNNIGYKIVHFGKDKDVEIVMDKTIADLKDVDIDIKPPMEHPTFPKVSLNQRKANDKHLIYEDSIRNSYIATFVNRQRAMKFAEKYDYNADKVIPLLVNSRGNHSTLEAFLTEDKVLKDKTRALSLLEVISQKDLRDVSLDVLLDHFKKAIPIEQISLLEGVKERTYIYNHYVLNPRVDNEMLTPYRYFFETKVLSSEICNFIQWCQRNIHIDDSLNSYDVPISPEGVLKSLIADSHSRDIFFVSYARSKGWPARINSATGDVEYYDSSHQWKRVSFDSSKSHIQPTGILLGHYNEHKWIEDPKYYAHFTLSKFDGTDFKLLNFDVGSNDMGSGATFSNLLQKGLTLSVGKYMLVTGTRLSNGGILSRVKFFTIYANQTTDIMLELRHDKDQFEVLGTFFSDTIFQPISDTVCTNFTKACGRGFYLVGLIKPSNEPTNHALHELITYKEQLESWGRPIVLLFQSRYDYNNFDFDEFNSLPSTVIWGIDLDGRIYHKLKHDLNLKGIYPMFIIGDTFHRVFFSTEGYNIGVGEQLMKFIHSLK